MRRFQCRPIDLLADGEQATRAVVAHLASLRGAYDTMTFKSDPERITPVDILAVSALGTPIPIAAGCWLLGDEGQWLTTEILARIDRDADLWSCGPDAVHDLANLYHLVRRSESQFLGTGETSDSPAMGQATATRLLAAKRPRLVPVAGAASRRTLGYRKDDDWWRRWRMELDHELLAHVRRIRHLASLKDQRAAKLSELRILDIALRDVP